MPELPDEISDNRFKASGMTVQLSTSTKDGGSIAISHSEKIQAEDKKENCLFVIQNDNALAKI